ncbi:hypothetical protein HETIRDRAFT_115203 [Heterobasidion irregulare TC 32-1]|uniref:Uncharacterized protein n=1 Tax=Heterobasidion irregulare (strain TC 32-1) TaxID=747525 RepID=W4KKJ7_HETIT|nr:uncharacterized protein HETIRDRAFT_115203 [Heterobasidion irregulare TC 32-1]ETW85591.1 hypothetical protein HETIRDRAFT_115203 [Heterobasidion irregulare TC 32-1]
MPSSLVNLLVSTLSDLITVSLEHPAELEDFMTWGQNFAHTLARLEAIPLFEPSPQLAIWLNSAKDTLETYMTNDWLAWGTQILQTHVMCHDKRIQAEVTAATTAQAEVTCVAEVEAHQLADEERIVRGVTEEARWKACDWEIMGLYVRGFILREESEHHLAKLLETEAGPSMASTTALSIQEESLVPSRTGLFLPDGEEEVVELDWKGKQREVVDEERKGKHCALPIWMSVKSLVQLKAEADREAEECAAKLASQRAAVDRNIEILRWQMAWTESEVRYLLSEHEVRGTELAKLERACTLLPEGSEDEDEDGEGSVDNICDKIGKKHLSKVSLDSKGYLGSVVEVSMLVLLFPTKIWAVLSHIAQREKGGHCAEMSRSVSRLDEDEVSEIEMKCSNCYLVVGLESDSGFNSCCNDCSAEASEVRAMLLECDCSAGDEELLGFIIT